MLGEFNLDVRRDELLPIRVVAQFVRGPALPVGCQPKPEQLTAVPTGYEINQTAC